MIAERVARLEKEAQSLKRVSEEVFRVQKQVDTEKVARESASGQLQSDLQQLLSKPFILSDITKGINCPFCILASGLSSQNHICCICSPHHIGPSCGCISSLPLRNHPVKAMKVC